MGGFKAELIIATSLITCIKSLSVLHSRNAAFWGVIIQPNKLATAWSLTCKFTGQELMI